MNRLSVFFVFMEDFDFIHDEAFFVEDDISLLSEEILSYTKKLHSISTSKDLEKSNFLYKEKESSINLPFDGSVLKYINECISEIGIDKLKYIIVVGIGGSNLGTKAIYDGIRGKFDLFLRDKFPKIIFLDTTDEVVMGDLCEVIKREVKNKEGVLLNIISKSGNTTETIVNFETLNSFLQDIFGIMNNRIVVTTSNGSKLWDIAKEKSLKILEIPKSVGGRYSVFSPVGLFPLAVCGFDIESLLMGARIMHGKCIKESLESNPAVISSALIYLHNKNGVTIHNSFFFNPELESLGKWYRQLMGESIGKKFDTNGKEVNSGITPIVSIGSTDLHSMAQLYFGGPKDKLTTFVYISAGNKKIFVPREMFFSGLVDGVKCRSLSDIMNAIFGGVKESYRKNKLPFMEVRASRIDEYFLGQFLQFKMIEMMYLAHLFGVNAFDQPNVEDYKKETRKILLN